MVLAGKHKLALEDFIWFQVTLDSVQWLINPLRPNNDLSQTSHCNIKGVSVTEVMRIEDMITQVQVY